jgi:two-component system, cell cycle sensor histidine kinase and response regulator CckA
MSPADTDLSLEQGARNGALRITACYAFVALAWILGSDFVVSLAMPGVAAGVWVHVLKGTGFVAATAACLYVWTYRELVRRERSTAWFRLLVDQAPDLIYRYRLQPEPGFEFVNAAATAMIGYSPDEHYADPWLGERLIHPDDRALLEKIRTDPAGTDGPVELRWVHRDGSLVWVEQRSHLVTDPSGARIMQGVARDITARKQGEDSTRMLATAVEASGDAVLICDADGVIRYVNPAFTHMSGYSAEESVGQTPRMLKSGRQSQRFYAELWATVSAGRPFKGEFVNRRKDGSLYTQQATITPVMDDGGELHSIVAVARDVTVERRLEEQLRRSQMHELIGRMASGTAHDFKNFLAVIELNADVAKTALEAGRTADLADPLHEIRGAARRGADLVRRLLALGRNPDALPVEPGDLARTIETMRAALRTVVPAAIDLSLDIEPGLPPVMMSASAVEQIVLNLVSNASQALAGSGQIHVRVHCDGRQNGSRNQAPVQLSVSDDGPGIPDELLERVFEPFFTTRGPDGGSGLGLPMVRALTEQQGASLRVTTQPGQGTCMTVIFAPAVTAETSREIKPMPGANGRAHAGQGERVLLVDDEPPIRRVLERILTSLGYTVVSAADGVEAQARLVDAGAFDLVVTDLHMPRAGGIDVYRRARELGLSSRFLFMSGEFSPDLSAADFVGDRAHFLEKPYTLTEVSAKLREVLDAA